MFCYLNYLYNYLQYYYQFAYYNLQYINDCESIYSLVYNVCSFIDHKSVYYQYFFCLDKDKLNMYLFGFYLNLCIIIIYLVFNIILNSDFKLLKSLYLKQDNNKELDYTNELKSYFDLKFKILFFVKLPIFYGLLLSNNTIENKILYYTITHYLINLAHNFYEYNFYNKKKINFLLNNQLNIIFLISNILLMSDIFRYIKFSNYNNQIILHNIKTSYNYNFRFIICDIFSSLAFLLSSPIILMIIVSIYYIYYFFNNKPNYNLYIISYIKYVYYFLI